MLHVQKQNNQAFLKHFAYRRLVKKFAQRLREHLTQIDPQEIPTGYARIGNCAIIKPRNILSSEKQVGDAIRKILPWAKAVILQKNTLDITRRPLGKVISGKLDLPVIHKELRTRFVLNPLTITFSPGNHGERERLLEEVKTGTIVDMFACIGNLSLPLSTRNNTRAIAIEISPYTFEHLKASAKINKTRQFYPILGDSRIVAPQNKADIILMGFFQWNKTHLRAAKRVLKNTGRIYLHYISPYEKDLKNTKVERILEQVKQIGLTVRDYTTRIVKPYSRGHHHDVIVLDVKK